MQRFYSFVLAATVAASAFQSLAGLDAAVADIDPFVPGPEPLLPPPDRKTESGEAGG